MHTDPAAQWGSGLADVLRAYRPADALEARDLARLTELVRIADDPWVRSAPLHATASALIVHPDSRHVLLRWHQRQQAWLQVGGHGDPGEDDPIGIALREAAEETGLRDLKPWPTAELRHVVIVPVPAGKGEPAHEHGDLRFVLATSTPEQIVAEQPDAPLRWLPADRVADATTEANLVETLGRVQRLLDGGGQQG